MLFYLKSWTILRPHLEMITRFFDNEKVPPYQGDNFETFPDRGRQS